MLLFLLCCCLCCFFAIVCMCAVLGCFCFCFLLCLCCFLYIQAAALSYPINALVTPAAWHTELPQGKQKLPQVDIRIGTPIWNHHFFNGFNLSIVRFTCRDTASNRTNQYVISMFQMHFPNGTLRKPSFRQMHEQNRKQNPPAWHSDLPQSKLVLDQSCLSSQTWTGFQWLHYTPLRFGQNMHWKEACTTKSKTYRRATKTCVPMRYVAKIEPIEYVKSGLF